MSLSRIFEGKKIQTSNRPDGSLKVTVDPGPNYKPDGLGRPIDTPSKRERTYVHIYKPRRIKPEVVDLAERYSTTYHTEGG